MSGADIQAGRELPLGHKIACRLIEVGEKVMKYGAPIGSATRRIEVGEHVGNRPKAACQAVSLMSVGEVITARTTTNPETDEWWVRQGSNL